MTESAARLVQLVILDPSVSEDHRVRLVNEAPSDRPANRACKVSKVFKASRENVDQQDLRDLKVIRATVANKVRREIRARKVLADLQGLMGATVCKALEDYKDPRERTVHKDQRAIRVIQETQARRA